MKLAGCIIKNAEGKVLLVHRNTPKRTHWEIPGGKIDPGETPEQTAIRELKEELDIIVKITRQVGIKTFEQDGQQHEYHWFEAKIVEGKPRVAEPDVHDKLQHFAIEEMQAIKDFLSANTKNLLMAAQSQDISL